MNWLLRARRMPSCVSAIGPDDGGTEHARLREGVLWPGSPRNFATEPATFYDMAAVTDILGGYFSQTVEFRFVSYINGAALRLGCVCGTCSATSVSFFWAVYNGGVAANSYPVSGSISPISGDIIKIVSVWGEAARTMNVYVNDVLVQTGSFAYSSVVLPRGTTSITNFSIDTVEVGIGIDGSSIFNFPSISERLRLITNTNVLNRGTHWEAANSAVAARIDTALDLRGVVSNYTVLVDFEAAKFTATSGQKQELAGQGTCVGGGATICSLAYYGGTSGVSLQLSQEIGGIRTVINNAIPVLSGRHTAAGSVTVGGTTTKLKLYIDGQPVKEGEYSGIPSGTANAAFTNYAINDNRYGVYTNQFGKIYAAALFNEALTADQIAYLSN